MDKNKILAIFVSLAFLLVGLLTLSDYGVNSDEHIHFTRGQASLRYLITGKANYSGLLSAPSHKGLDPAFETDQKDKRRSIYQSDIQDMNWFWKSHLYGHPASSDLLAALTNFIFFQKANILGDLEAHHLFSLTASALLVLIIFVFSQEFYGGISGLVAALALSTYPLFLGESRFNVKDPPETFFYAASLYCFWKGVKRRKARYFLLSAFFFGWGMGTKFNILFLLINLLLWLLILFWKDISKNGIHLLKKIPKKIFLSLFVFPFVAGLIFWITNPILWKDPVNEVLGIVDFYHKISGLAGARSVQSGFLWHNLNFYPILTVFYTTPLVTLFLSILGILSIFFYWKKEKYKTSLLVLFWFFIPILRVTFPPASIYGGLRQIMEYIPAMAILAGVGGETLRRLLVRKIHLSRNLATCILVISFLPIIVKMIRIHPNQNVYFNPLIDGLAGAARRDHPFYGNNMGNVYLQGVDWVNKNAEKNAKLALPIGNATNLPWLKLREDISFYNPHASYLLRGGEYVMDTFYQGKIQNYRSWHYRRYLEPIHEIKVEGVPLLKIWKNTPEYVWPWLLNTEEAKPKLISGKNEKPIVFDFGKMVFLERFDLKIEGSCYEELERMDQGKSEKLSYSVDGQNWQIEFENSWNTQKWLEDYFKNTETNVYWRDKRLTFFFAVRKARFLRMQLPENCFGEMKDWRARVFSDVVVD